jgi:cell division protein FtsQ
MNRRPQQPRPPQRIRAPRMTRRPRPRRPGRRGLIALLTAIVVLGGGFLWLRSSSLVAVRRVVVTGLSGPNVGQIRTALRQAALSMTTLDYSTAKLRRTR